MYKTAVYTLVNGRHAVTDTSKRAKIIKSDIRQQHMTANQYDGASYHLFMIFALFDVSVTACRR